MCKPRRTTWLLAAVLSLALTAAGAAPLPSALQDALDRAVVDHEAGRNAQARRAFEALARRGVAAADYNLAVMHLRGQLPRASRQRGQQLLLRAARNGFVTAQLMLGRGYENGDFGRRDLSLAHQWYEVAAQNGSVQAQVEMGTAHYLGRGRAQDAARAVYWFRQGAVGGDVGAMYLLASMYEQGDGAPRDLRLARYWYDMAARNGDEAAPAKVQELDALAAQATPPSPGPTGPP